LISFLVHLFNVSIHERTTTSPGTPEPERGANAAPAIGLELLAAAERWRLVTSVDAHPMRTARANNHTAARFSGFMADLRSKRTPPWRVRSRE
jgi:hypothetical protein